MPRELGRFPPAVAQLLLRLPRDKIWRILDALQRLCDDPHLLGLFEEDDQPYILAAGHAVFVEVDDASVIVLDVRKLGSN
jgi:hypothetical protein